MRIAALLALHLAAAAPAAAQSKLTAVVAAAGDDARAATILGEGGEVFAPDGKGAWTRSLPTTTATKLSWGGRSGGAIVALGERGIVYRLADNGWTAIRLVQKGSAVTSQGANVVAAVGRQLFALDRTAGGEPAKLALAPAPVIGLGTGAGKSILVMTERGLFRLDGTSFKKIERRRGGGLRLISDRWALSADGIVDLRSNAVTALPAGLAMFSTATAAVAPAGGLVGVGTTREGLELVTLEDRKLVRDPIPDTRTAAPVGVVLDRAGRAVVALADGRVGLRERGTWTLTTVREALPAGKPGSPPATAP